MGGGAKTSEVGGGGPSARRRAERGRPVRTRSPQRGPNRGRGGIGQGAGRAQLKAYGCCTALGRAMCISSQRALCAGRWQEAACALGVVRQEVVGPCDGVPDPEKRGAPGDQSPYASYSLASLTWLDPPATTISRPLPPRLRAGPWRTQAAGAVAMAQAEAVRKTRLNSAGGPRTTDAGF